MDKYNHPIARLLAKLHKADRYAITVSKNTTWYSCDWASVSAKHRAHEDKHKDQYAEEGWFWFVIKYIGFSIIKGYTANPYEVEARLAEIRSNRNG